MEHDNASGKYADGEAVIPLADKWHELDDWCDRYEDTPELHQIIAIIRAYISPDD